MSIEELQQENARLRAAIDYVYQWKGNTSLDIFKRALSAIACPAPEMEEVETTAFEVLFPNGDRQVRLTSPTPIETINRNLIITFLTGTRRIPKKPKVVRREQILRPANSDCAGFPVGTNFYAEWEE